MNLLPACSLINISTPLPRLRIRLCRCPLRAHLALDPPGLSPRSSCGVLRLLHLLFALASRLLLFALLDRCLTSGLTCFGALRAALFDYFEGGADDATLGFDGAAGAFLGDFLEDRV